MKRGIKRTILACTTIATVAVPTSVLPLGIYGDKDASNIVRYAYAATYPEEESTENTEVLIEDWALISDEEELVDVSNMSAEQDISNDGDFTSEAADEWVSFADVPTYTVVQQFDESDLPIELLDTTVFAPDNTQFYILVPDSIIKESPDMSSATLCPIGQGTGVTRIGIGDTWSKIRTESGTEGYVLTTSISDEVVWIPIDRQVWVDADSLSLRSEASTDCEVLATLPHNARLRAVSVSDKWYEVITDSGLTGFVYISYTTQIAPPTPTPVPRSTASGGSKSSGGSGSSGGGSTPNITGANGSSIVSICQSMLGVPYVWAGESSSGVDCSGLVVYAYRQIGKSVPHQSESIKTCGYGVSRDEIQLGDVICWDTGGGACGHVGIYVGGGQVIHASNTRGEVCYGSLDMMPILSIRRFL
ncbi:MAG: NlpC/P60 family protein [Clostridia bacterium]|nr:NlpC/P60 family protein [Clostridia bacterium]